METRGIVSWRLRSPTVKYTVSHQDQLSGCLRLDDSSAEDPFTASGGVCVVCFLIESHSVSHAGLDWRSSCLGLPTDEVPSYEAAPRSVSAFFDVAHFYCEEQHKLTQSNRTKEVFNSIRRHPSSIYKNEYWNNQTL